MCDGSKEQYSRQVTVQRVSQMPDVYPMQLKKEKDEKEWKSAGWPD